MVSFSMLFSELYPIFTGRLIKFVFLCQLLKMF